MTASLLVSIINALGSVGSYVIDNSIGSFTSRNPVRSANDPGYTVYVGLGVFVLLIVTGIIIYKKLR